MINFGIRGETESLSETPYVYIKRMSLAHMAIFIEEYHAIYPKVVRFIINIEIPNGEGARK